MWITSDVELPQPVIDAHAEGQLVFFVGAGASFDAPSSLPLFGALARQLAELACVPFDEAAPIDFFLGSMPENFDTHTHARELIAPAGSAPNSTHAVLVRLASATGPLRIVTTNFDDHLSSAASARNVDVCNKWFGPALPLGDDFAGIVHIHGSVLNEPRGLVLTDSDFGRAYLTYAWATRFLLPMFQKFTVLFIGYSHDDPIMRYLALGLPSRTPRYAFTGEDQAGDPKWTRLGVETIAYPVRDHDHGALVASLEAWDARARMGRLDQQSRMAQIVEAGSTLTPVDHDYASGRLQIVDGARQFAMATAKVDPSRQLEWLRWIEGLPEFKALFDGRSECEVSSVLAYWYSDTFVASSECHGAALQTVQRLGQTFSDVLFHAALSAVERLAKSDPDAARRWKVILATSVLGRSAPIDPLELSYEAGELAEPISVLRAAVRPFLVLKRPWFVDEQVATDIPDAEATWSSEEVSLTSHVLRAVVAAPCGDPKIVAVLEESLNAAYDLLDVYHGASQWDRLGAGRSAIEAHDQDQFRNPIDAIIDGLRAYGEKALSKQPTLIERWWCFERPLFRRLSLHLLHEDESRTPDQKIDWLLDRSVLYEPDIKHEVYRVLNTTASDASGAVRERLLSAARVGPNLADDLPDRERHDAYMRFNLVVWLVAAAPSWADARDLLAELRAANPDFEPREHPDFDSWMTSGTRRVTLPMEPDVFAQALADDPKVAMDGVLHRDYSERNFDEPRWGDALSLVRSIAGTRPELGEQIWTDIDSRTDLGSKAIDLHEAIIEGWAKADLGEVADTAVARVGTVVSTSSSARSVSKFILEQVQSQIESAETPALTAMRKVAHDLWAQHGNTFTHRQEDVLSAGSLYLNCWPGDLTRYWITEIDRRWRKQRDEWSGLNGEEGSACLI
ncbi:SIR2 family protein [Gordonia sp. CPCC 205333]|uniref:SIR2 family protein n=1 Tax=Gordonia sp. CPCC 205333 TaxID=3140790 RepID=UPI003AF3E514